MSNPELHYEKMQEFAVKLETLTRQIEEMEHRWLELSELALDKG